MPFVQFRVHPSVGCARFGGSVEAYHLACEFPMFLQEQFPDLRFKPRPRTHPRSFFGTGVAADAAASAPGTLATFEIFNPPALGFANKFKDAAGDIFPQAARFRVFAYVYADDVSGHPVQVFEITPDLATIQWKVNIANKKSVIGAADPSPNTTNAPVELDTASAALECKRMRPVPGRPNLAYLMIERDEADKARVTNRLHVIGNEGEIQGTTALHGLWSNEWSDAAGDGSVEAVVAPVGGGAPLRQKAGGGAVADFKYLSYDTPADQPGSAATVTAMPGWVIVGCPDYAPDIGHFVSLWDTAFARASFGLDQGGVVAEQPGKHKQIINKSETEVYKRTDYYVHIHPQLCLFDDVKSVSGEAFGQPEHSFPSVKDRAHNKPPDEPTTVSDPSVTEKAAIAKGIDAGGPKIDAHTNWAQYADPNKFRGDPHKPIKEWLKIAIFNRLRKPQTLYLKSRNFLTVLPGTTVSTLENGMFPRKLGRRLDYDGGPDQGKVYNFPDYGYHEGDLLHFHGHPDFGHLCGGDVAPSAKPGLTPYEETVVPLMDDMYWPATAADMPLLRELAYTQIQYNHFQTWQAEPEPRFTAIYPLIATSDFHLAVAALPNANHEQYFDMMLRAESMFVPSLIDMACLGAMLGGSFLPGIEVGREAGVYTSWTLFHGATDFFPDVRFKKSNVAAPHTVGTLTKDLAVPWSEDFAACEEEFWPTSRPGIIADGAIRRRWLPDENDMQHVLHHVPDRIEYVKTYWRELGFIRRDGANQLVETEQKWRATPP
ncbi:MAG: hypothetical protein EOS55_00655 [Mesorhizobium sp.]|nr:MAG: hypothetical protein EOS55_00655 [Mesorhizobium sp.]